MKRMAIFLILVVALGCISPKECEKPYLLSGTRCCLDENDNKVCDDKDMQSITLVVNVSGVNETRRRPPTPSTSETTTTLTAPYNPPTTTLEYMENQPPTDQNVNPSEEPNQTLCFKSIIHLNRTGQDGYVADSSQPPDAVGDGEWIVGYNMIGTLPNAENSSLVDRYKTVLAFPLTGVSGKVAEARIHVLPYLRQGNVSDTLIEHILCEGDVWKGDYGSEADDNLGVIVKSTDTDEVVYSVDVTKNIQADIDSGRSHSCYRLYWDESRTAVAANHGVNRIIFDGYGGGNAPYISYYTKPCIRCRVNSDCNEDAGGLYKCIDNDRKIVNQYVLFHCENPGTLESICAMTQESVVVDKCRRDYKCVNGENMCFPDECYGGVNESAYQDVVNGAVCGMGCRPCHCFDGEKDENELDVDCGKDCRPCPFELRLPSVTILYPTRGRTYGMNNVYLGYESNKYDVKCFFSLNDDANSSIDGGRYISAMDGENVLRLYCNDSKGNVGGDEVTFYVESNKTVCPADTPNFMGVGNFDGVAFYEGKSSGNGPTDSCNEGMFDYITKLNDSAEDNIGAYNLTAEMMDKAFNAGKHATLYYTCSSGGGYELSSIRLKEDAVAPELTDLYAYVYFTERSAPQGNEEIPVENPPGGTAGPGNETAGSGTNHTTAVSASTETAFTRNSFWRVYPYKDDGDSVNPWGYADIPYAPENSSCGQDSVIKYQALNLTNLLPTGGQGGVDARIVLYSKNRKASLDILEIELSAE